MRAVDKSNHVSKYNWCPRCKELWIAEWMAAVGASTCPLCETPVVRPRTQRISIARSNGRPSGYGDRSAGCDGPAADAGSTAAEPGRGADRPPPYLTGAGARHA